MKRCLLNIVIGGLILLMFSPSNPGRAQGSITCPFPEGRKITNLPKVLVLHAEWLSDAESGNDDPRRANFCNAYMRNVDLRSANLVLANMTGADLEKANLSKASLYKANLSEANLAGAELAKANLSEASLYKANLNEANLAGAELAKANLSEASLYKANLSEASLYKAILAGAELIKANLNGANLYDVNLAGAKLSEADLRVKTLYNANMVGADLQEANLEEAYLYKANLERANLNRANLKDANLRNAKLAGAVLVETNLEGADLASANLERTSFLRTSLTAAKFPNVSLFEARYQPATAPAQGWLSGIRGLQSVKFCPGETSGLAQLRAAFKAAGLRSLEREATYALETGKTNFDLGYRDKALEKSCPQRAKDQWTVVDGVFRLVAFGATTGYGLHYGRPLKILVVLIPVFAIFYVFALTKPLNRPGSGRIFRIWPAGRINQNGAVFTSAADDVIEPLQFNGLAALKHGLYFSIISAFHIGWRDLNVGSWIARLQPREYTFRAIGWVRVVAGAQSLLSVYLIAMWALTYFGRPFG